MCVSGLCGRGVIREARDALVLSCWVATQAHRHRCKQHKTAAQLCCWQSLLWAHSSRRKQDAGRPHCNGLNQKKNHHKVTHARQGEVDPSATSKVANPASQATQAWGGWPLHAQCRWYEYDRRCYASALFLCLGAHAFWVALLSLWPRRTRHAAPLAPTAAATRCLSARVGRGCGWLFSLNGVSTLDPGMLPCRVWMGRRSEGGGHTYIAPGSVCVAL